MKRVVFDSQRPLDFIMLGRIAIDFNPVDYFKPLDKSETFRKYLGGSPANIAVGMARLGKKVGFFARVSDDQFGKYVVDFFENEGIDTSRIRKCTNGEKLGLTFTEILSETQSSILMYREGVADLQLSPEDIDEDYVKSSKALLISGTALSASPSREAAFKAISFAEKHGTVVVFDIDYRPYTWKNRDEISVYYSMAASGADIVLGSRDEYDLTERLITQSKDDKETAKYWCERGAEIVLVKHGKSGSTAYTADGRSYSVKPFPVKALKGFGGGDGYAAAFLYGLLEGMELIDCLEMGSAEAAMLVASHACSADMPDLAALEEFIARSKKEYGEMVVRG